MTDLTDKNVVVMGAAPGTGATVVGMDVDADQGEAVVTKQGGSFFSCDVSDTGSWEAAAQVLLQTLGKIDHLPLPLSGG